MHQKEVLTLGGQFRHLSNFDPRQTSFRTERERRKVGFSLVTIQLVFEPYDLSFENDDHHG